MSSTNNEIIAEDFPIENNRSKLLIGKCSRCESTERLLFPIEAARVANVSSREIFRRIEEGKLHFIETDEKVVLICSKSVKTEILDKNMSE